MSMGSVESAGTPQDVQAAANLAGAEMIENQMAVAADGGDPAKMHVSTVEELKQKYPKMYEAFLQYFVDFARRENQRAFDRMIQNMKKRRYESQG